jgi:hypothetical protein
MYMRGSQICTLIFLVYFFSSTARATLSKITTCQAFKHRTNMTALSQGVLMHGREIVQSLQGDVTARRRSPVGRQTIFSPPRTDAIDGHAFAVAKGKQGLSDSHNQHSSSTRHQLDKTHQGHLALSDPGVERVERRGSLILRGHSRAREVIDRERHAVS